ncbi:MAG: hypothetical protein ACQSGP_22875 [Frankia sp.]
MATCPVATTGDFSSLERPSARSAGGCGSGGPTGVGRGVRAAESTSPAIVSTSRAGDGSGAASTAVNAGRQSRSSWVNMACSWVSRRSCWPAGSLAGPVPVEADPVPGAAVSSRPRAAICWRTVARLAWVRW